MELKTADQKDSLSPEAKSAEPSRPPLRVGVMSFLHNDNFGSSLQAFALQHVLRGMGLAAEHIDYRPDRTEKIRNLIESGNHPKLILEGLRKRQVKAAQSGAREKSRAIPAFYARRMNLSPVCKSRSMLKKQCAQYDLLICGSDQIWNPVWLNPAYFLPFSAPAQRKISYAASLGVRELPNEKKQRKMRRWLKGFSAVSVREAEGAALLERITGEKPAVMPDPVCLLRREEWEEIAEAMPAREPYLLCYFIGENPGYWETVSRLAARDGLKVLVIPVTAGSFVQGFDVLDGLGPEAFLGAIRGAAAVCTDSFHCYAFSCIFGRPCTVCRRDREDDPESKNSRIDSFRRTMEAEGLEKMRETGLGWLREQTGGESGINEKSRG